MRNLIFVLLFLTCCQSFEAEQIEAEFLYDGNKQLVFEGLIVSADLYIQDQSRLKLRIKSKNKGDQVHELFPPQLELLTEQGLISTPTVSKTISVELKPGDHWIDTLTFEPINDMGIYKFTSLKGDLGQRYTLNLSPFLGRSQQQLTMGYELNETDFIRYQLKFGSDDEIQPFVIDHTNSSFEKRIEKSLKEAYDYAMAIMLAEEQRNGHSHTQASSEPSYQLRPNEILLSGVVISLKVYGLKEDLFLDARIINHQSIPIQITQDQVQVITQGASIKGHTHSEDSVNSITEMKKGDRTSFTFKFRSVQPPKSLKILLPIGYNQSSAILLDTIPMVRLNLPNRE